MINGHALIVLSPKMETLRHEGYNIFGNRRMHTSASLEPTLGLNGEMVLGRPLDS